MRKILTKNFFSRPTLRVAEELLGKYLVRRLKPARGGFAPRASARASQPPQERRAGLGEITLQITEVEAYDGFLDKASHASRGKTKRNAVMFGTAGCFYVYFVYGMHWMLNVVTGEEGYPAAVLIRGTREVSGPGRLAKFLRIDGSLCGAPARPECGLWFEDRGEKVPPKAIVRTARVGVAYAGAAWAKKPYRFLLVA